MSLRSHFRRAAAVYLRARRCPRGRENGGIVRGSSIAEGEFDPLGPSRQGNEQPVVAKNEGRRSAPEAASSVRRVQMEGERALVTGSTAGIGRAVAIAFAAQGADVVVTGRNSERGEAVVAEIAATGAAAHFLAADLHDEAACTGLVDEAAARLGGLTVLVNNAAGGDSRDATVAEITTEAWEAILRVDLTAPMWCARASIPHMRAAGHGSIVNISSRQGERPSPGLSAYVAAKAGLNGLTRAIAVEEAPHGIRCNTVSPGYVLNDRRDAELAPERRAALEGMHLTRLGVAADVSAACVYLASDESGFVTGINLQLDGGSSIARGRTLG
jgi:NAD(P)-dependent dehydrogenase (short-subunit alcohol dehydrogenase family)